MTARLPERLRPLPIRVRPRPGEPSDSFIRRLARANHLKPSYLHGFLHGPPLWFGKPRLDRLAALLATTPEMLQRTLAEPGADLAFVRPLPNQSEAEHEAAQLCFEIRRDAEGRGLTIRTLAQRHKVSRRTVRRALNTAEPPAHVLARRRTAAADSLQALIDPMLEKGMIAKEIWISLVDEYDVTVSISTLVRYAANWRLDRDRYGQTRPVYYSRDPRREP